MNTKIKETAQRIKGVRELLGITVEDMALVTGVSENEYLCHENGECDFSFTFLNNCAEKFDMDIIELLTGETPHLSKYSIVRKDEGLTIRRREGFKYQHLGYKFKDKLAETFLVVAPYEEDAQDKDIHLSSHEGQEFDYVLEGSLKIVIDGKTEVLNEGDSIYYNSAKPHGMIATGGNACKFLAVTIHN